MTENRLYEVMVEGKDSEDQKKQHSGMEKQENPERENGADPQEWLEEHLYRYISHDRHREWTNATGMAGICYGFSVIWWSRNA